MTSQLPQRKHLKRIPVWIPDDQPVIYFVTVCCYNRKTIFNRPESIKVALLSLVRIAGDMKWGVKYICFMPDHVHLFISPLERRDQRLAVLIQRWKSSVQQQMAHRGFNDQVWHKEFFDHLLRSGESLEEKWNYVRLNPVRAGLCKENDEYPYCGSMAEILSRLDSTL